MIARRRPSIGRNERKPQHEHATQRWFLPVWNGFDEVTGGLRFADRVEIHRHHAARRGSSRPVSSSRVRRRWTSPSGSRGRASIASRPDASGVALRRGSDPGHRRARTAVPDLRLRALHGRRRRARGRVWCGGDRRRDPGVRPPRRARVRVADGACSRLVDRDDARGEGRRAVHGVLPDRLVADGDGLVSRPDRARGDGGAHGRSRGCRHLRGISPHAVPFWIGKLRERFAAIPLELHFHDDFGIRSRTRSWASPPARTSRTRP
jgi:hypothetical protein